MDNVRIRHVVADHPDAVLLVSEVQAEYVVRYGTPDESPVDVAEFTLPAGAFYVGYVDEVAVLTGAWRRVEVPAGVTALSAVEVKRMYVRPAYQRRGLARAMLAHLEQTAREAGHDVVVLGTGSRQPEAIALYESSGYARIPGFGHYGHLPDNNSFAKSLLAPPG